MVYVYACVRACVLVCVHACVCVFIGEHYSLFLSIQIYTKYACFCACVRTSFVITETPVGGATVSLFAILSTYKSI